MLYFHMLSALRFELEKQRGSMVVFSKYRRKGSHFSKTCVKGPLSKRPKLGIQDQLSLNAGQKYCRMLQGEHSAIYATFIELPFVIKIFVLSNFEWLFYTGFTVLCKFYPKVTHIRTM